MKKIILTLVVILALAIPHSLFAQSGWIKTFPGPGIENGNNIVQSSDGNYVFPIAASEGLGSGIDAGSYIVKIDIDGNIIWTKMIDPEAIESFLFIINTPDNGFLIQTVKIYNGISNQPYFIKLDANGNEEWSDFYFWEQSNITNIITDIIVSSDGGYLVSGKISSSATSIFVRKLDASFNEIWTYERPLTFISPNLTETTQGEIGVSGDDLFIKLDANGNSIWEEADFASSLSGDLGGMDVISLDDGSFMLFTVGAPPPTYNRYQIKMSADGDVLWIKDIGSPSFTGVIFNPIFVDDGFVMTGTISNNFPTDGSNVLIQKTDFDGNIVWENQVSSQNISTGEFSRGILQTDDGGFMGVGLISTFNRETFIYKTDALGYVFPNKVIGKVAFDEQTNCIVDSDEEGIEGWVISATSPNNTFYTNSDSLGNYILPLEVGDYELSIHPPNALWNPCENGINISVSSNASVTQDFPMEAIVECPLLAVDGGFPIARPCFDNNRYHVQYCNEGTAIATDAYVEITMDEDLSYVSSSIPLASQNGNILTFNLGDIPVGTCESFYVNLLLDCNAPLGERVCITSHIYPDTFCLPTDPNWNGAFIEVDVTCENDVIKFYLKNTGTNDMLVPQEYLVVEDAILLMMNNFQLLTGQIDSFSINGNGSTYTMIAEQVTNAPGNPYPIALSEGCGTNGIGSFSMGYINQFSLGDDDPFLDDDCRVASNSYDPNDKQGFPIGYESEHYIRPNTDIEYLIRFQNTGTDTAFTVIVKDEISSLLDITSIRVGTSSHPMEWKVSGENLLEFTFNEIMLPDSYVNEIASHGFVEFKISQKPDLPEGTIIKNDAGIYFDFNDPIITNETFHTIGLNFITVSTQNPISNKSKISVRPNPFQQQAIFELENMETTNGLFELFDISGKRIWQQKFSGQQFELKRNGLKSGIYFYKISDNGKGINSGKIIVN